MSPGTSLRTCIEPTFHIVRVYGDRRPVVLDFSVSADLEITVAMLVQIDKLVQLIESPVFTCA